MERKKEIIAVAGIFAAAVAVILALFFTNRLKKDGQVYTYIDYYEGTTKEIKYYIDGQNRAYNYDDGLLHKRYEVMVPENIVEKNKNGEMLVYAQKEQQSEASTQATAE